MTHKMIRASGMTTGRICFTLILVAVVVVGMISVGISQKAQAVSGTYSSYNGYCGWVKAYDTDNNVTAYDGYTEARSSSTANSIDYTNQYLRVGQSRVLATGSNYTYSLQRGMLYFDTTGLPENTEITAATVVLYPKGRGGNNVTVDLVSGNSLVSPPTVANYGYLLSASASFTDTPMNTTAWTASTVDSPYYFTLNSNATASIMRGGVTRFGIRVQEDINSQKPGSRASPEDGDTEYVDFWTSSGTTDNYWPRLYLTYTEADLGIPAALTLYDDSVEVYRNYDGNGDGGDESVLVVFRVNVEYVEEPSQDPRFYYQLSLYDGSTDDLIARTYLIQWGNRPASIWIRDGGYIMSEEGTYTLKIEGCPYKFDTTDDQYEANFVRSYDISSNDWKGSLVFLEGSMSDTYTQEYQSQPKELFKQWLVNQAKAMGEYDEDDVTHYIGVTVDGDIRIEEEGTPYFYSGIPNVGEVMPFAFMSSIVGVEWLSSDYDIDSQGTWSAFGSMSVGFNRLGDIIFEGSGLSSDQGGQYVAAFMFILLMFGGVSAVLLRTGNVAAAALCAVPILLVGNAFMVFPWALTAAIGALVVLIMAHQLWLKST